MQRYAIPPVKQEEELDADTLQYRIYKACKKNDVKTVLRAIDDAITNDIVINLNQSYKKKYALQYALYYGNALLIVLLLNQGADINKFNPYGLSNIEKILADCVLVACIDQQTEVVKTLINYVKKYFLSLNLNEFFAHDSEKKALHFAVEYRDNELIKLLIAQGANPNLDADRPFSSPIIQAAENLQHEIVGICFTSQRLIDISCIEKIMHLACKNNLYLMAKNTIDYINQRQLESLPHHYAKIKKIYSNGLLIAIEKRNPTLAQLLLDHGAYLDDMNLFVDSLATEEEWRDAFKERGLENAAIHQAQLITDSTNLFLTLMRHGYPVRNKQESIEIAQTLLSLENNFFSHPKEKFILALAYLLLVKDDADAERLKAYCFLDLLNETGIYKQLSIDFIKTQFPEKFRQLDKSDLVNHLMKIKRQAHTSFLSSMKWPALFITIHCFEEARTLLKEQPNDFEARYQLAYLNFHGLGCEPNKKLAYAELLNCVLIANHLPALQMLIDEYAHPDKSNNPEAQLAIGKYFLKCDEKNAAHYWLKLAVVNGNQHAESIYYSSIVADKTQLEESQKLVYTKSTSFLKIIAEEALPEVQLMWAKELLKKSLIHLAIELANKAIEQNYEPAVDFILSHFVQPKLALSAKSKLALAHFYTLKTSAYNLRKAIDLNLSVLFSLLKEKYCRYQLREAAISHLLSLANQSDYARIQLAHFYAKTCSYRSAAEYGFAIYNVGQEDTPELCGKLKLFHHPHIRSKLNNEVYLHFVHLYINKIATEPFFLSVILIELQQRFSDHSPTQEAIKQIIDQATQCVNELSRKHFQNVHNKQSFTALSHFAETGNKTAQFLLACHLYSKPESLSEAETACRLAADNGHPLATRYQHMHHAKCQHLTKYEFIWNQTSKAETFHEQAKLFLENYHDKKNHSFRHKLRLFADEDGLLKNVILFLKQKSHLNEKELIVAIEKLVSEAEKPKESCMRVLSFLVMCLSEKPVLKNHLSNKLKK